MAALRHVWSKARQFQVSKANWISLNLDSLAIEQTRNALHVVWAGSNDFLDYLENPFDISITSGALESTILAVERLHQLGARKILVVNLPDLGLTPAGVATQEFYDAIGLPINISSTIAEYNSALDARLDDLGFGTIRVDSAGVLQDAVAKPRRYWLRNVTDPYLPFGFPDELPTGTPFGYLFWDVVHPTTHGHFIIAIEAWKTVQRNQRRNYLARGSLIDLPDAIRRGFDR